MNKHIYYIYITALVFISLFMITGCSTYLAGMSDPIIISRSPSLEATGVASNEDIIITFNKKMDTDTSHLQNAIKFINQYDTAQNPTTFTTAEWSTDGKTLTIVNPGGWVGGDGSRVYWTASNEGFKDENGNYLIEGAVIVDYFMSGFGIVGRSPYYGQQNVSHPRTLEVTLSMPITIDSFSIDRITASMEHTAMSPTIDAFYLSNGNRTINIQVRSWGSPASKVALMVSSEGILDSTNTYTIPSGTWLWYYGNSN